jgi:hypothetical protein
VSVCSPFVAFAALLSVILSFRASVARIVRIVGQTARWGKPSMSRAWAEVAMLAPSASVIPRILVTIAALLGASTPRER